ncbi:MAG: hypothetical protein DWI10_04920 [Planctomycetota bacterium]|nr:MAG: hypothetical protein DWI10_04920 [Planctomycetota bacterium]
MMTSGCVREMVLDVRVRRYQGRREAMDHPHACFIERADEFSACHFFAQSMIRMETAVGKPWCMVSKYWLELR